MAGWDFGSQPRSVHYRWSEFLSCLCQNVGNWTSVSKLSEFLLLRILYLSLLFKDGESRVVSFIGKYSNETRG